MFNRYCQTFDQWHRKQCCFNTSMKCTSINMLLQNITPPILTCSIFFITLWHCQGGWMMQPGKEALFPVYRGAYYKIVSTRSFACPMPHMSQPRQYFTWQFSAASQTSQIQKARGCGGKCLHQTWESYNYSLLERQYWNFTMQIIPQRAKHDIIHALCMCV